MSDPAGHRPEPLAERIRALLPARPTATGRSIVEKRIIGGGIGFLVDDHLCVAATSRGLTVRLGPAGKAEALTEPWVIPHRVGQRETSAFAVVEPGGLTDEAALTRWIDRGLAFAATL